MDEHALRVLEFDKVLARLGRLTSFSAGSELALALRPSASYTEVFERQCLLAEAMLLREQRTPLTLNSAVDVRPALEKAALGGTLDGQELLAVAATQKVAHSARGGLLRAAASLPRLGHLGSRLIERQSLVEEIGRALDQRGEVIDNASTTLAVIRRDIKVAHDRLQSKLQEFLGSAATRQAVQEPIVTLRDGRYVVPIKADFRGEVRGIVHDVSSSGATVFVEPLAVVDLANQWRELQIEEKREIDRILRRLSALVGNSAAEVSTNVQVLAELDLALAAARLSDELMGPDLGVLPDARAELGPESWLSTVPSVLELVDARHPLLAAPVPITLKSGGDERVLLITGPNTGGKTVALKTAGLLCLMSQAGLPVPASADSRLPVFEEVLADIGDEQSIEQSLSTFSGHLRNVIALLQRVGPGSLVLLDELAAGTDPTEGAALARALLKHLLDSGATTLATTHHGELKLFAHATPGIANAAVEFDSVTLAPTYHIVMGVPGRSNALAIAARLGLPEPLLRDAQESLAPEEAAMESLLAELHAEREAAAVARRAEEVARKRAEDARTRVEARLAGMDEERARRLDEAALALEAEVEAARAALARAQRLADRRQSGGFSEQERDEARSAVTEATDAAKRLRRRSRRRRPGGLRREQILPGVQVWVQGIPMAAEVLSAPDARGEVDVSFGGLRARVGVGQIVRADRALQRAPERVLVPSVPSFAPEQIEVRGQTLDEALPRIERFLDDGFRAGVPRLRVVHGKGTGKMRQAVRALLAKHPLVKGYNVAAPAEGGEGVTVIEMALGQ
jgi:DNA mismatch repair protein MutS2